MNTDGRPHGNYREPSDMVGLAINDSRVLSYFRDKKTPTSKYDAWFLNVLCGCGDTFILRKDLFTSKTKTTCNKCVRVPDLKGKCFGTLEVISYAGIKRGQSFWNCLCSCGVQKTIRAKTLPTIKTCGCISGRFTVGSQVTHGLSLSSTYKIWSGMIQRATNKDYERSEDYVNRGISVSDDWKTFENFLADMGERPKGLTLERVDNNASYSKENCKWETRCRQQSNRRVAKTSTGRIGVTHCLRTGKYTVKIKVDKRSHWLGRHTTFEKACEVIEEAELRLLGYSRKEGFAK